MMLVEFESEHPAEIAYKETVKQVHMGDLELTGTSKNERVVLKGKRLYNTGILVVLIVLGALFMVVGLIIPAIYYWTRPYQKIVINFESSEGGRCLITMSSNGQMNNITLHKIKDRLKTREG